MSLIGSHDVISMRKKSKHISILEREAILLGIENGLSATAIGTKISKDRTTVTKELKRNAQMVI